MQAEDPFSQRQLTEDEWGATVTFIDAQQQ